VAGVNKKFNSIEKKSKYYVECLTIYERSRENENYRPNNASSKNIQRITFYNERSYSSACIKRIVHNASIGYLQINASGSSNFHREFYNLIKEFDMQHLTLLFMNERKVNEMMTDSYLLDLTRACKTMNVEAGRRITPEAFHQVYKNMMEGSWKLRKLFILRAYHYQCIPFLSLIGMIYRNGEFHSNREFEVYQCNSHDGYVYRYSIFDGFLQMELDPSIIQFHGIFYFLVHETRDSLEKAKNRWGLVRINISTE
ncbi:hypothetical protein PENTCL1PPCAC_12522, partial [Pristionchus entomophagus]